MAIDKRAVFAKTPKGKDEIETRQNRLPAKLRMALILVDGKSSVTDLIDKGSHPDLIKTLEELTLLGFIRDVSTSAAPMPAPAAANPPAQLTVKLELIRISRDILGPQAEKIVKKIEESPDTKEALGVTLKNCIELVRLIVDEKFKGAGYKVHRNAEPHLILTKIPIPDFPVPLMCRRGFAETFWLPRS